MSQSREFMYNRERLKETIKNEFSLPVKSEEGLELRKLKMKVEHLNRSQRFQRLTLGHKTSCTTKTVMLVGATGTGKTTLINAMVNYIYGVSFEDKFRFILIDDEVSERSLAESQTDFITAYTFYHIQGMPFDYNYVLIDTPGYGDTRGIHRDQEMIKQFEAFLNHDCGVNEVDAIGFVTPVSVTRLTQTQRYVFDGLSSLFGSDVQENVYIMGTFADAKRPPVKEALKEAGIYYVGMYKFNNSALFAQNKETGAASEESEESIHMSKLFWDTGCRSMKSFFLKFTKTSPIGLQLTKTVLKVRSNLQLRVSRLEKQINVGLKKLDKLEQEKKNLAQITEDMKGSANFREKVNVTRIRKINLRPREFVSNCINCSFTCHYPCSESDDVKWNCPCMSPRGYCRQCPSKCFWNAHKNMQFRYEHTVVTKQRVVQKVFERYNQARSRKMSKEKEIRSIEKDLDYHSHLAVDMIKEARKHTECLDAIALKPNPLSSKAYIDLLIESEKMEKHQNFRERISMLQNYKQGACIFEMIQSDCQVSGVLLLEFFQNLMKA